MPTSPGMLCLERRSVPQAAGTSPKAGHGAHSCELASEPAGTVGGADEIGVAAAAARADEPAGPVGDLHIRAVSLGLLAGIEINPVQAIVAPDMQQHVRPGRAAERHLSDSPFLPV